MMLSRVLLLLVASVICAQAMAAANKNLGVGIYMGVHRPALEDLNNGEFKSAIGGFATVFNGQGNNETKRLNFQNPLPGFELGVNSGLEFQWRINNDYSILFGGSTWAATSRALTSGGFYLQGAPADVINERIASLSYNEFFFGVRRNVVDLEGKYKI